jgi:hypothetical protein
MKELMARVNGNQDVDGHERYTPRFIIRISDRINFVINNGSNSALWRVHPIVVIIQIIST